MPVQSPQWSEFLSCPICYNEFEGTVRCPISLGCGHTLCRHCLAKLQRKQCPFDQTTISTDISQLPINSALLQLVSSASSPASSSDKLLHPDSVPKDQIQHYLAAKKCIEELALYLKTSSSPGSGGPPLPLSRPMQRKLVTLINCQVVEEEGRARAMRAARSLGERSVTELILQHQNPQQLSANLWAAVRARGCQFLGPAMQEEVLRLVLLALEDGSALSRKVLVMFVVQRLASQYPQASKTSIGHVVQLLYRASCFKVSKREGDSSLMQLKEEFRGYEALRREHDAQIVQIATEAGLRIAPEQWSSLLYGDAAHKSHMQSIIDKLQTPQSFSQSVQELVIALQRTGDPGNLAVLRPNLELLSAIDPSPDASPPQWEELRDSLEAARLVVKGLVEFIYSYGSGGAGRGKASEDRQSNAKYKTSMCRDLTQRGSCPRGANCTFAHSHDEMERYRAKNKKTSPRAADPPPNGIVTPTDVSFPPDSSPPPPSTASTFDSPFLKENTALNPDTPAFQPTLPKFQPATLLCGDPTILVQVPSVGLITTMDSNSKSLVTHCGLAALQQRKQEILAQLDKPQTTTQPPFYSSPQPQQPNMVEMGTYSPWTSNNIFSYTPSNNLTTASSDDRIKSKACFYPSEKDEFIPFGAPLVSKYGPISRTAKSSMRGGPIQVSSTMGELTTSPTSSVRHPLPSASLAPTFYTLIPSDQYPSLVVPVATGPALLADPKIEDSLPFLSELQLSAEGKTSASRRLLHEELLALERQIQENERFTPLLLEGPSKLGEPKRTVPTSIGPWPTQTLEQELLKDLEACWTQVLDDDATTPN